MWQYNWQIKLLIHKQIPTTCKIPRIDTEMAQRRKREHQMRINEKLKNVILNTNDLYTNNKLHTEVIKETSEEVVMRTINSPRKTSDDTKRLFEKMRLMKPNKNVNLGRAKSTDSEINKKTTYIQV